MTIVVTENPGNTQDSPTMEMLGGSDSGLATPSVPLSQYGRGGSATGQFRTISHYNVYRSQPWAAATIRPMAFAIARLGLHLLEYLDASGDERRRDRKHAAALLLERPRPGFRTFHLLFAIAVSLYVHGHYVAYKRRASRGAPPFELWELDWRLVMPVLIDGKLVGWRWYGTGVPGLNRGDLIFPEDIVHLAFAAPGGADLDGISPLEQLGTTVRSEQNIQRYSESYYRNGTRFGAAVIMDKSVKAEAVDKHMIRAELADVHGGVDKAFTTAVLGGGVIDIKPLAQQTAAEAEIIGQREVNRVEFAAVIGIPLPMAGVLDGTNYASLTELHRLFYTTSLGGPLDLIAMSLQAQLLDAEAGWDDDNRFLEFSLDRALKGDAKTRWETYKVAVEFGGLTLNDVRRKENLPPFADARADEPLISANNVRPLSAVGTEDDLTDPAKAVANGILSLVAKTAGHTFDRARAGVEAGDTALHGADGAKARADLVAELQAAGFNGSSQLIAGAVVDELEQLLAPAATVDDVDAIAATYPLPIGDA